MSALALLAIGIAVVLTAVLAFRLHAFLALLLAALTVGILTPSEGLQSYAADKEMSVEDTTALVESSVTARITAAFGRTCGKIGILIALASIIGSCLLASGSADRIVRAALAPLGEQHAPKAFLASGFTLGIPVFFDTVFYLMVPLARAATSSPARFLLFVLSITAGATMAHSLVPPTPGPLYVAGELGVELSAMIPAGLIIGLGCAFTGYLYARWITRNWNAPLAETPDASPAITNDGRTVASLPPLWLALAPIALPIVLIAMRSHDAVQQIPWLAALGDKNLALGLAAAIALVTRIRYDKSETSVAASVQTSLQSAGVIILITSAGGAFGAVLQQTGIASEVRGLAADYSLGILPLAFGITAIVRAAQGSATVAMITATGIVAGSVDPATLGYHPVYVALAIGCGSKPFQWMNDSGFWIVCTMSGMRPRDGLRTLTPMLTIMGVAGLAFVLLGAWLLPLA